MDVFRHLRHHTRVVTGPSGELVSVGADYRYRRGREAAARRMERERERSSDWANRDPDHPSLTALGRARVLAARAAQGA